METEEQIIISTTTDAPIYIKEAESMESPRIVKKKSTKFPLCVATKTPLKTKMEKNTK